MVPAFVILNLLRRLRYFLFIVVALCLLTTARLYIFQKDYNIRHIFYLSSYIKNFNWVNKYPRNIPVHRYHYFNHHNKTFVSKKSSTVKDQLNISFDKNKKKGHSSTSESQKGHKMTNPNTGNMAQITTTNVQTSANQEPNKVTSYRTEQRTQNVTTKAPTLVSQKGNKVTSHRIKNKAQKVSIKAPTLVSQEPYKVTSHSTENKTQNVTTKAPTPVSQKRHETLMQNTDNKTQNVNTKAPTPISQKRHETGGQNTDNRTQNVITKAPTPISQKVHKITSHGIEKHQTEAPSSESLKRHKTSQKSDNMTQNVTSKAPKLGHQKRHKIKSHSKENKTQSEATKATTPVSQKPYKVIRYSTENKTQNVGTIAPALASQKRHKITSHNTEHITQSATTRAPSSKRHKTLWKSKNKTQIVTPKSPTLENQKLHKMSYHTESNEEENVTTKTSTILDQRWKREIGLQKCNIPSFDALHPQILPFVNLEKGKAEKLKRYGKIVNGKLKLKLSNVQRAGFYYLRRFKDYNFKLSSWNDLMSNKNVSDIDVSTPLKEEFIRLDFTHNNENHTEYLSHVIENDLKYDVTKRHNDEELNIVMVMLDSQSHKNVERQLRKTYRYLKHNPYTVILNNHVITGDGTSSNLAPMLTGKYLTDLPEARGWINGSKYLDAWPFIFRDFQKLGYVTLLGDDDPRWGAFQYRLKGFNKQPTDKYLLPFQFATKRDEFPSYSHQYAFEYLRKFARIYTSYKHFSLTSLGMLGHNDLNRIKHIDDDAHSLLKFFRKKKYRNNTAILFFGDHGHRFTKLRQTIWGKLEERLPFMSITFPPWFFKKYKKKISFLKMNSHLLTSHFDIYQTLRHILFPDTYKKTNDIGESLFTNIARLNRTCKDAGVPAHFCPCKEYRHVSINDTNVVKMCRHAVAYFNELLGNITVANEKCSKLELGEIIRARSIAPSETMQKHDGTYDTEKCDRCGLKSDKNFKMKVTQYEIVFSVEPSRGIFESLVEYLHDTGEIRVHTDVSRVNRYGDDPNCIADKYPHLRKYCLCKMNRKGKG